MTVTADWSPADPEFDAAVLTPWRSAGRTLVQNHYAELRALIEPIEALIDRKRYADAAAAAQLAANHAVQWHPGLFASPSLERILCKLGKAALPDPGGTGRRQGRRRGLAVLHVASRVAAIGGGSRMMWRWIGHDGGNVHSVAITRQYDPVPPALHDAVTGVGGRIRCINRAIGGLLTWARRLQSLLRDADLVVLHADNMDVIPFLGLAGMRERPPIVLVNHSDHVFWLGAEFADLVVSTRRSGLRLCAERRGIAEERNILLPLCLEPVRRRLCREEAKRAMGLPDNSLVILSVARAVKFKTIGGESFADALVSVLRADSRLRLVAVGPGGAVDWSKASAAVPGQILTFAERPDTKVFLEAADVYVDSFPFVSITSMFEAGLHGLPIVTRYPFGPGCEVLGADSPGLDPVIIRTRGVAEFQHAVQRLVVDQELRAETGSRTRAEIEAVNMGEGWKCALARVYQRAFDLPRQASVGTMIDESPSFGELDLVAPFVYGNTREGATPGARLARAAEINFKALPPGLRLRTWASMAWKRDFRYRSASAAWRYLVPEWLGCRARSFVDWRI